MQLNTLPRPLWMQETGADNDVVVSTRCRLARNLAGFPFPWRATELQRKQVAETTLEAVQRAGGPFAEAREIAADTLTPEQSARLLEWRYASQDWLRGGSNRWLIIARDTRTSLLINEEDHLRLQTLLPGLQVESTLEEAYRAESALSQQLAFAQEESIGYLTASLANAGAAMRLSVLVHLAGLAVSETLEATLEAVVGIGCSVRGLYGEGTQGIGELFQVSNTFTYGTSPERIAERVELAARYLAEAERRARRQAFGAEPGRTALAEAAQEALQQLFQAENPPRRLLPLVSILRLAIAEGILQTGLAQTAEWVALAGADAALSGPSERASERFQAIQRSASLRQRLRDLVRSMH
jgi:protein arginine kinase